METVANREARLRRRCQEVGTGLETTRRTETGSEHGPYRIVESISNFAVSERWYPNGMTLEEAEAFLPDETQKSTRSESLMEWLEETK